jgi:phosphoserine phosphatase RsbU/P
MSRGKALQQPSSAPDYRAWWHRTRRNRHPCGDCPRVNQELVRRTVDSRFATLFYGVLAPKGRLTYCNAGHNPPFVVGGRGVRRLDKGGLIIGAFKEIPFHEETVQLDPGEVLIVFSDGVTEALSVDDIEFGEDRLLGCVDAHREATAAVLLDSLIQSVREFRGRCRTE